MLRRGDIVEVRSAREILDTLDERGELDALPFMPEMLSACGHRYKVAARAERVCDTITETGARRMLGTVLLDDRRCDGSGHDRCEAECRIYWKESWLKLVTPNESDGLKPPTPNRPRRCSIVWCETQGPKIKTTRRLYRCQATQAVEASIELSGKDVRTYLREYTTGNVPLAEFTHVMGRAVAMESAKRLHLLPDPAVSGTGSTSPRMPAMGLQPGDWVRVKQRDEIEATLNDKGRNRGLWFDREMLAFCGKVLQVRQRITRLIDDRTGQMIQLTSDCVTLDGAVCSGTHSLGRWFCPREIYPYWREGWLERIDPPANT